VEHFISPAQADSIFADALFEDVEHTQLNNISPDEFEAEESARKLVERLRSHPDLDHLDELVLVDQRTDTVVSHCDVGIGISQVLPVLVHAFADRGQLVASNNRRYLHPPQPGRGLIHRVGFGDGRTHFCWKRT
jgi:hypothetical protein